MNETDPNWIAAAIGICSGMGRFGLALTCGLLALIVLWIIGVLERSVHQPDGNATPSG